MLSMRINLPRAIGLQALFFLALCVSWEATDGARTAQDRAKMVKRTRKPRITTTTGIPTSSGPPTVPPETLRTPAEIKKAMEKSEIIPDLLRKAPKTAILVRFEGNSTADLGNHLWIRDLDYWAPFIHWTAKESRFYTMLMLNLDMPSRQNATQREWIVWLVGNIPGAWVMRGDQIIEYEEPDPPKRAGSQRYVVLVYHQKKGKIKFREYSFDLIPKLLPQECRRQKFQSRFFADDYGLGDPIGINFFETKYEKRKPHVPTMDYEEYANMK